METVISTQEETKTDNKDVMMDTIVSFFMTKLNKNDNLFERLPIRKIDGLKLDVFIKSFKQYSMTKLYLLIESSIPEIVCVHDHYPDHAYKEYFRKDFALKTINNIELKKVIAEIIGILHNLKFSKLYGVLMETDKQQHTDPTLMWKTLLISSHNIEWSVNECPVCMEETFSTSMCGHHLCRYCFQKLKKFKCPTCRQNLSYDDDDDDDDTDEDD